MPVLASPKPHFEKKVVIEGVVQLIRSFGFLSTNFNLLSTSSTLLTLPTAAKQKIIAFYLFPSHLFFLYEA